MKILNFKTKKWLELKATLGNTVYNSLRQLNINDKKIVNLKSDFFNEKSQPIFPQRNHHTKPLYNMAVLN